MNFALFDPEKGMMSNNQGNDKFVSAMKMLGKKFRQNQTDKKLNKDRVTINYVDPRNNKTRMS